MSPSTVYVAVHAGAGHHNKTSERPVKEAMKRACTEALRVSSIPGTDILSIVERAIVELENDENINAGTGSNLTLDGTVECDAAIMDGSTGEFGGGGAPYVSFDTPLGVKNPIKLAKAILCHSRKFDGLGRIPPLMLVSSGARSFAMQNGLEMVDPESMISKRAKEDWQKWMERYNDLREGMIPESKALLDAAIQDTVGAVAWDDCGNVAAGVSSGGLLLKNSGRVGEAAIFGAGCWAQQPSNGKTGVACSVSGTGEHIIRVGMARAIGDALHFSENQEGTDVHDLLLSLLTERKHDVGPAAGCIPRPNAGVLLLTAESGNSKPRLWCAFTAEGMAIAYASSDKPIPKVRSNDDDAFAHDHSAGDNPSAVRHYRQTRRAGKAIGLYHCSFHVN
ncbi:hypothetical protein PISMIDRAFT_93714 [Pisolithus microcarpus 441]|uniref:Asparaginase n=1 Tax=Pisolithus microcarpus 441 TaxID=765257 RepID=A0A0C9YPK1_9AGAM|nr:hypothetical protein PISMIDRAFT_93714 [Pisolithus microcarpus 441]